jgi:hypothetical protein
MNGDCGNDGCFFAALAFDASRGDEPLYPFALLITPDGELRQVEQIWGP